MPKCYFPMRQQIIVIEVFITLKIFSQILNKNYINSIYINSIINQLIKKKVIKKYKN